MLINNKRGGVIVMSNNTLFLNAIHKFRGFPYITERMKHIDYNAF